MSNVYRIIIFLLVTSLAACTATPITTAAGGDEDKDIGLGGTGKLAGTGSDAGSGLGGTGILGEITGFGSIFVNGIEVEYDDSTAFTIDGETAAQQQLEIGDVVEVLTADDNKHTRARIINLRHEVIGRVESVDLKTFSFTVNGQDVVQAIHKVALPEVGSTVAVSGFRIDEKTILSTRTTPADAERNLLRTHTDLPFKGKTDSWLVQTHVQIDRVSFELEGNVHTIELEKKKKNTLSDRLGIKILQLKKSVSGQLELDHVIEPAGLLRGRQAPTLIKQPGSLIPNSMQRAAPVSNESPQSGPMHNIKR